MKESSPKYSMTARRDAKSGPGNPGPGAYTPGMDTVKPSSPRHTLHSRLDSSEKAVASPGPAHYHPQRPVTSCGIALKSRIDIKPAFSTPSPAAYQVGILDTTIKPMAPKYSLGARDSYKPNSNSTPGPGAYETAFSF